MVLAQTERCSFAVDGRWFLAQTERRSFAVNGRWFLAQIDDYTDTRMLEHR